MRTTAVRYRRESQSAVGDRNCRLKVGADAPAGERHAACHQFDKKGPYSCQPSSAVGGGLSNPVSSASTEVSAIAIGGQGHHTENRADNLVGRSFRAMGWSYSGVAAGVLLQIVASVVFARVLGARVVGVFAFGLLVFPPFRFLCEFGLGSALVQKPKLLDADVELAFARSLLFGVITAAAWVFSIDGLAGLMHQAEDADTLRCFALVLLCLPAQTLCTALLTRRLDQKFLQITSLVSYGVGYVGVGAYGALRGWGVWSLILGFLFQNTIATAMLVAHTRLSLRGRFSGDASDLWRFGSRITAINISNWLTSSLDNLAVAWFFGTRPLGLYSVAYGLVRAPADRIVTTLQNVLFPASVLARKDPERLAKGCIAMIDGTFLLVAPAFCSVAMLAPTIVEALYGQAWLAAAPLLLPLALSMIFHCLTVVTGALLWGSGGVGRDLRIQWSSVLLFVVGVALAGRYSLVAIAWVVLPVTMLRAGWGLVALIKTVRMAPRRVWRGFLGGTLLTAVIVPMLLALDLSLRASFASPLARISAEAIGGLLLWCGLGVVLRERIPSPELRSGLRSLQAALRRTDHA